MPPCLARRATPDDAESAVAVLRESITQLCVVDHQNDPATLERWLRNKTVDHFQRLLDDSKNFVVVAEVESVLCGVGLVTISGDIHLCYVRPGSQRSGIGRAILHALEAQAMCWGLEEVRLRSSADARSFYERHGYLSAGESGLAFGVLRDYPYCKVI